MKRRDFLATTGVGLTGAAAGAMLPRSAFADETIKIGAVAPRTGPLAGGATVTHWPNIEMWVQQVNAAGGLQLESGPAMLELIQYDDQTNPSEHIKAAQRLANQDEVDFIIAPYATGFNVAAAPIYADNGYPQIAVTAITDQIEELTGRYPSIFFTLGSTTAFVEGVRDVLVDMRDGGIIGSRVATVNVADAFGIELADVARSLFEAAGFELVYDQSYPLGTPDLSPVMKGAKDANPDAFVAWSYPPDTFGLTEQAIIENLDVRAFYTAVASSFPAYRDAFGDKINNTLGAGGVNPDTPDMQAYRTAHQQITGQEPDYWASANTYASLQILQQAIEGVGRADREAVTQFIKDNSFETIMGPIAFENQNSNRFWTVGQWQDGVFRGIASSNMDGAAEVRPKEGW